MTPNTFTLLFCTKIITLRFAHIETSFLFFRALVLCLYEREPSEIHAIKIRSVKFNHSFCYILLLLFCKSITNDLIESQTNCAANLFFFWVKFFTKKFQMFFFVVGQLVDEIFVR